MASIVVVGGGLAGLACAWKLGRAGHEVELLERRRAASGHAAPEETEEAWLRAADQDVLAAAAALAITARRFRWPMSASVSLALLSRDWTRLLPARDNRSVEDTAIRWRGGGTSSNTGSVYRGYYC